MTAPARETDDRTSILAARGVTYAYPGVAEPAVRAIDLRVDGGELVGIVGPNGSGKTTLLRVLAGLATPSSGEVDVLGRDIRSWDRRRLACTLGVVSQREEPAFPIRVRESVTFGRYPHLGPLGSVTTADRAAVEDAMRRCDVLDLESRWVGTLSGGEWQRVRIARALAQQPQALILDEATANLDIRHEMEVFELMAALVRDQRLAGVMVTHHVNLAARFVDRIVVMSGGRARTSGPPGAVLTREVMEEVFEWPVEVMTWDGAPQVVPVRR